MAIKEQHKFDFALKNGSKTGMQGQINLITSRIEPDNIKKITLSWYANTG